MTETSNKGVLSNILQIKIPQSERIKTCKNEEYNKVIDRISIEIRDRSKRIKKLKIKIFDLQEHKKSKSKSLQIQILRIELSETKYKLKELITKRKKILSNEESEDDEDNDATFIFGDNNRFLFSFSLKDVRKLVKKYFSKNTSIIKNNKKLYINFYDLTIQDMQDKDFKTNLFIFCYEMRRNGFLYYNENGKLLEEIKDMTNDLYKNLAKRRGKNGGETEVRDQKKESQQINKNNKARQISNPNNNQRKNHQQKEFTFFDALEERRGKHYKTDLFEEFDNSKEGIDIVENTLNKQIKTYNDKLQQNPAVKTTLNKGKKNWFRR